MQHTISSRIQVQTLERGNEAKLSGVRKHDFDLGRALEAQQDSPLGPGKEFKLPDILESVFGLHSIWQRMKDFLNDGSKWPLDEINKEERGNDLNEALTFGNHKGTLAKPELLLKLIGKDVKYGYSIPIPLNSMKLIPGIEMAPMNIMTQNMINEFGQVIPKD